MKFKDITQFTQLSGYHVNVGLHYFEEYIERLIEEYGLELNPDFQRGHVWNEEKQIRFVEYFLRGGCSGTALYFNHPTWMDFHKNKIQVGYDEMVLVDGLQRTTAILRFLRNEIMIFDNYYFEDFEDKFSLTDNSFEIHINNLSTRREVLTWYLEMNAGGVVHTEEELNKVRLLLKEEE